MVQKIFHQHPARRRVGKNQLIVSEKGFPGVMSRPESWISNRIIVNFELAGVSNL